MGCLTLDRTIEKFYTIIENKLDEVLSKKSYAKESKKDKTIFKNEKIAYALSYDEGKKLFKLCNCSVDEGKADEQWLTVSTWLFDPDEHSNKDAIAIAEDFIESIVGKTPLVRAKKTKKKKTDDNTIDAMFLINRLVNIWPELKADVSYEKENYESFRSVTFVSEKVLPLFKTELNKNNSPKLKKIATVMSDMYKGGDLDARGIITSIMLNSIDNMNKIQEFETLLSEELKKAWKYSRKLKGKKIKPEKPKKEKNNIFAQTLRETSEAYQK